VQEAYISVDIEAAGPFPPAYSMLSLGAVAVEDSQATFYAELRPMNDNSLLGAMKVVGRTLQDFAQTGQEPKAAMAAFRDWLGSVTKGRRPVFVGFNAAFDWSFVNFYFHHHLGENPFGIGGIDIKSYYMGLSGCTWEDTRSSRIPAEFKSSSLHHTHNALDDAIEQAELFKRIRARSVRNG
jgi:DNA polymerase III epsilon subunit-like protein